jgi:hypothetical protein
MNVNRFVSRIGHHVSRRFRHNVILITLISNPAHWEDYGCSQASKDPITTYTSHKVFDVYGPVFQKAITVEEIALS